MFLLRFLSHRRLRSFIHTTILQEEITKRRSDYLRMNGKELDGLGLKELQDLENQLSEGISAVKYKKVQIKGCN